MMYTISFVALLNFILYNVLNYTLKKTELVSLDNSGKNWLFRNHFCSLVHSTVSSAFVTYSIYKGPYLMEDPIYKYSIISSYVFAASTGYFLYDMVDIIIRSGLKQWILIIHHLIILFALPYCIATNSYHGFGASALLVEWNSIFLHIRKLLKLQDYNSSHFVYKLNALFLFLTMLIFRYLLCFYLIFIIWRDRMLITWLPFLIGVSACLVFIPANVGLCYQIMLKDFFQKNKNSKAD